MRKNEQRKNEQLSINAICVEAWNKAKEQLGTEYNVYRLRACTANVLETDDYYFLKSYNTVIAFIDKESDTLYDMLRYVYGYTATSAQHIAKFTHDYGKGLYRCNTEYRYYDVD